VTSSPTRATSSRGCYVRGRGCRATSPFSLPRAYLIGRPARSAAVYIIVLPVCPCVVSFRKFHEPDAHDLLRTGRQLPRWTRPISSRHPREDAIHTRNLLEFKLKRTPKTEDLVSLAASGLVRVDTRSSTVRPAHALTACTAIPSPPTIVDL